MCNLKNIFKKNIKFTVLSLILHGFCKTSPMKEKIYLLPGLMTDERLWSRLVPFLEEKYELVHISLPLTDNFDEASNKLEKIFKEEQINLLGFSLGAYLACYFTVNNPSRVKRLFLLAGTPGAMNKDEIEKRKQTLLHMNNFGFKGLSHKKVLTLIEEVNHNDEELIDIVKNMFSDLGSEVYTVQMKSTFNRKDISEKLISLDLPIYFYYSTEDRLLSHRVLKNFTKEHNHISINSRVGTSHMVSLESPSELAEQIENWMRFSI